MKAILFGGPADGHEQPIRQGLSAIVVPYYDRTILYYYPEFTGAGKLATDSEGRVIFRYRGLDYPPEVERVP